MNYLDRMNRNKFLDYVKNQGSYEMGEDEEADALYDAYRLATGKDKFMQDATIDSVSNLKTSEIDGNTKSFFDRTSTITDNPTGNKLKSLMVQTPTSFTQRFVRPSGIIENDIAQPFGAPQSLSVQPYASGGRVGLFMGGSPLTGEALAIYNSMNAYGYTDKQIADRLSGLNLYTPGTTTPPTTPPVTTPPSGGGGGGGGEGPTIIPTKTKDKKIDEGNSMLSLIHI